MKRSHHPAQVAAGAGIPRRAATRHAVRSRCAVMVRREGGASYDEQWSARAAATLW